MCAAMMLLYGMVTLMSCSDDDNSSAVMEQLTGCWDVEYEVL